MADGAHYTIASAAKTLKAERKRQKLSLEDVSRETCIRTQFLKAIEEGDNSQLPSSTFAIGFVRTYARLLRLNEEEVITAFRDARHVEDAPSFAQPEKKNAGHQGGGVQKTQKDRASCDMRAATAAATFDRPQRRFPKWLMPGFGLAGAIVCWNLLQADQTPVGFHEQLKIAEISKLAAALQADYAASTTEGGVASVPDETDWQAFSALIEENNATKLTAAAVLPPAEEATQTAPTGSLFMSAARAERGEVVAPSQKGQITLVAAEDTWVRLSNNDGTEVWSGILGEGESYHTSVDANMMLTTSNAGGLFMQLGEAQLGPFGARGEIIETLALDGAKRLLPPVPVQDQVEIFAEDQSAD